MKVGENLKMPHPQHGRSIKTYTRGNNDAPSITKYGSPVRLDAQIVALRLHYARTALKAPPLLNSHRLTHMHTQEGGRLLHCVGTVCTYRETHPRSPATCLLTHEVAHVAKGHTRGSKPGTEYKTG